MSLLLLSSSGEQPSGIINSSSLYISPDVYFMYFLGFALIYLFKIYFPLLLYLMDNIILVQGHGAFHQTLILFSFPYYPQTSEKLS
jgi:hypothetical protein